jgi:hypothetical protein
MEYEIFDEDYVKKYEDRNTKVWTVLQAGNRKLKIYAL